VIVTGAAGTIGVATATELERQGWQVIRLDREEDLRRRTVGVNLADPADIRTCFRRIEDEYGGADALVNNAGIFVGKSWDEITDEEVDEGVRQLRVDPSAVTKPQASFNPYGPRWPVDTGEFFIPSSATLLMATLGALIAGWRTPAPYRVWLVVSLAMMIDADLSGMKNTRGLDYLLLGELESAGESCETTKRDWQGRLCMAILYERLHRHPEAESERAAMQADLGDAAAYQMAEIYAQWGAIPKALDWLETAYRIMDSGLISLREDALLDPLRKEPRLQAIERKLNFPI